MSYHSKSLHPSHPAEELFVSHCVGSARDIRSFLPRNTENVVSVHFFGKPTLEEGDLPDVDDKAAALIRKMVEIGGSARMAMACLFAKAESDGRITCTYNQDPDKLDVRLQCGIRHDPELVSPPSEAEGLEVEERLNRGARVKPNDVIGRLRSAGITLQLEDEWARWHVRIILPWDVTIETGEAIQVEGYFVTRGLPPEISERIFRQQLSDEGRALLTSEEIDALPEKDWKRVLRAAPPGYQLKLLSPRVVPTFLLLRRRNGS